MTATVAAVACADAAGAKSIAITNAVSNVVLSLSKTTSWFPWEHGWIRMDAEEFQFSTFRYLINTKKGESRSSPL